MTEQPTAAHVAVKETTPKGPNFVQRFANSHPRLAKAAAIIGGLLALVGVVQTTYAVRSNKDHLESAADHGTDAVSELSATVSPQTTEA